jgi:hypothetical protein
MAGGLGDVLGPVQVLLIGLDGPGSERMLAAELQDLHSQDAVRALDVLRVRRGPDGGLRRLDPPDPEEFPGTVVEALLVSDGLESCESIEAIEEVVKELDQEMAGE